MKVKMITREDHWAVSLLSTYAQLAAIKSGELEREITVFGDLFSSGVLIHGIIDQLQYSTETGELTLLDYKTRYQKTMPASEQKRGNALQLMIYKCLLDQLTCGMTSFELLSQHLSLDFSRVLSVGPVAHIQQSGLEHLVCGESGDETGRDKSITFGQVAKAVAKLIVGLDLPLVSSLVLQYEYQSSGEVIGVDSVEYQEEWMREQLEGSLKFWMGKKPAQGVDIEEAWKCNSCQFKNVCVWKKRQELDRSPAVRCTVTAGK